MNVISIIIISIVIIIIIIIIIIITIIIIIVIIIMLRASPHPLRRKGWSLAAYPYIGYTHT